MDFLQFVQWRQDIQERHPGAELYCETRIARAFSGIVPRYEVDMPSHRVHRCDLARRWCELRGLPPGDGGLALVCEGVRNGLGLILQTLARQRQRVALPRDVYPVYEQIAYASGIDVLLFETFPAFDLQTIFRTMDACGGADVVLLPAPLKLHGRAWTDEEVSQAMQWLQGDSRRRLILDGIYSFGSRLQAPVRRLLETEQTIYLDSLSKGWLQEQVFGVAMVPRCDLGIYEDVFRARAPSQPKLAIAQAMLNRFAEFPTQLRSEIDLRRRVLLQRIADISVTSLQAECGYLIAIESSATALLEQHGLLVLPATVFGSTKENWSIASALPAF